MSARDVREVADSIVEGCVAACGEFTTAELQAVADDPRYRDGWPGSLIHEYLNTWREQARAARAVLSLSEWADEMLKTHTQHRCPTCGYWAIWKPKPLSAAVPESSEQGHEADRREWRENRAG